MVISSTPTHQPAFVSKQVTAARRFYVDLNPKPGAGLTVVCGGWEECDTDYAIDRATFPFLSMEFVAAGHGDLVLGGKAYPLQPGTAFFYGPGVSQRIRTSCEARLVKYFVDFCGRGSLRLLRELNLSPGTVLSLGGYLDVRALFDGLVQLGSRHDRHTRRATALQLELLLIETERASQPASSTERRALATFERCRRHLDTHYLSLRTIDDVAATCAIDASYLSRLFRRFQRETPFRYLQRLQMQWAAERLHRSDSLVREVAAELDIDPFQFSRMFKRIHGVSPSTFLAMRADTGAHGGL